MNMRYVLFVIFFLFSSSLFAQTIDTGAIYQKAQLECEQWAQQRIKESRTEIPEAIEIQKEDCYVPQFAALLVEDDFQSIREKGQELINKCMNLSKDGEVSLQCFSDGIEKYLNELNLPCNSKYNCYENIRDVVASKLIEIYKQKLPIHEKVKNSAYDFMGIVIFLIPRILLVFVGLYMVNIFFRLI